MNAHDSDELVSGYSPPPQLLVTGHFRAQPSYHVYRPQGAPNWYLAFTLNGQGLFRQAGYDLRVSAGDLVLLSPRTVHDYAVAADVDTWEKVWAHFSLRQSWLSWLRLPEVTDGLFAVTLRDPQVFERARHALLQMHGDVCTAQGLPRDFIRHAPEPDPYHEYLADLDTLQLELALSGLKEVLLLATAEHTRHMPRALDPRVQRILAIIAGDPTAKYNINDLAQAVALSTSHLAHLFKHETGETIGYALLSLRMRQAARLLQTTNLPIGTIAQQLGYASLYYFSRQFHRHYGTGPRAFRNTLGDTEGLHAP